MEIILTEVQANRNRTLQTLYDNNIGNNIMISGDSHANWVSDLVWLDEHEYDQKTGNGSIGVEFGGTAVSSPSPRGQNITINSANNFSTLLVEHNRELQWSEIYYRGYFELHFTKEEVTANYFGMPTIVTRNSGEISLANFTVQSGANRLQRYDNGSTVQSAVENGYVRFGSTVQTNLTNATDTGVWYISHNNTEDI